MGFSDEGTSRRRQRYWADRTDESSSRMTATVPLTARTRPVCEGDTPGGSGSAGIVAVGTAPNGGV